MICPILTKESAEILVDYCAGTLDPGRAAEFEKHSEECADCRRLIEAQREVWERLGGWKPGAVSPDFDSRLYARIAQEEAAPRWSQWRRFLQPAAPYSIWKPVLPLAAACAVLAIGFLIRMPNSRDGAKQVSAENVDIEQVEKTLEDLDMLTPLTVPPARPM